MSSARARSGATTRAGSTRSWPARRVAALSDVNPDERRGREGRRRADAEIFATGEELIASDAVDAVLVTSWGATHEQYVLAAIAAGKPCFCEKPLATTAEGARRIVDAEVAHGKRLVQVGFMRRYDAGYRAAEAGRRQRDRRAADGPRRAPQPDGARAVRHADGDPRHADPRDRRVPLAARRRLRLGAGASSRARTSHAHARAQGPADRPARDREGHPHRRRGLRQLPLRLRHPVPGRRRGGHRLACPSRCRS